jgi:cathepsin L
MLALLGVASFSAGFVFNHEERSFVAFMREHNLMYTGSEYHLRFGLFLSNQRLVREFNSVSHTFSLSLNHLACLTPSEYRSRLQARPRPAQSALLPSRSADPPDSWDWRDHNAVVPPYDAGQCGATWAICAASAQADQWAIRHNQLIPLSPQELLDCVATCYGCDGGYSTSAYDWVIQHQDGHFMTEADYPYGKNTGSCKWDASKGVTTILSYKSSPSGDETALKAAVYNDGVPLILIDASHNSFQLYSGGIYSEPACSSSSPDHEMLMVGYGVEGTTPYWILQNTWGTSWGEKGYMRIARNHGNMCGIATSDIFPVDA